MVYCDVSVFVLCCVVLCGVVWCCVVLCCFVLRCAVLCLCLCFVLYCVIVSCLVFAVLFLCLVSCSCLSKRPLHANMQLRTRDAARELHSRRLDINRLTFIKFRMGSVR